MPFQQRTNTSCYHLSAIPTRGFTAALSVFGGTPPPKPLNCKSWFNHPGALLSDLRAEPTGGKPRFSCTIFSFALVDIIETSLCYRSQLHCLSLSLSKIILPNKKPCFLSGKQG
jgi:hypothetical protein